VQDSLGLGLFTEFLQAAIPKEAALGEEHLRGEDETGCWGGLHRSSWGWRRWWRRRQRRGWRYFRRFVELSLSAIGVRSILFTLTHAEWFLQPNRVAETTR